MNLLRIRWRQILATGLVVTMLSSAHAVPVFPEAVGFGSHTVAGRGGQVVRVTNLNDSGPGSLRHAVEKAQGPRVIVFDLSGVIELRSDLVVRRSSEGEFGFLTIAGQTAPPPGITLKNAGIAVRSHDVLIQDLAIRPRVSSDFATLPRPGTELPARRVIVSNSVRQMRVVWASQGAEDRLETRVWDVEPVSNVETQAAAFDWLDGVLKTECTTLGTPF